MEDCGIFEDEHGNLCIDDWDCPDGWEECEDCEKANECPKMRALYSQEDEEDGC